MAFFRKQRLRYQNWLNSFVVSHHDKWYMPLITIGLGTAYTLLFLLLCLIMSLLTFCVVHFAGWWLLYGALAIWAIYGIGKLVRVPGDVEWERQNK